MELQTLLFVMMYNYVFSNIKQVQANVKCGLYWDYLVSGPRGVTGRQISASSSYSIHCRARNGRLHTEHCGWSPDQEDKNAFIQVTFSKLKIVQGVVTQGRNRESQWVTSYSVSYSTNNINWSMAKTKNNSEKFQGNSNRRTMKINFFSECVEAKHVRIIPKTCHERCSLRFDVLGYTKLGDVNTKWKRHLIRLNRNEIDRLSPISNVPIANEGVCGIKCYQHPKCLSYMFDSVRNNCEIYERQIFQGNIKDNDHLGGPKYFVNTVKTAIYHVDGSFSNGTWSYQDGKEIPNTLWSDKEPKPSKGNLICVALTFSGLSTVDCTKRHGFICGV